jgi:hypothetical protein
MEDPEFGSLQDAVAQAIADGHKVVYDQRFKNIRVRNLTGAVTLSRWPGLAGKNGGGYEYAYTGLTIRARPTLPPNHGLNMQPKDSPETLDVMRRAAKILDSVGPAVEFVLGGEL